MAKTKATEATKKAADSIKKTAEKTVDATVEKAVTAKKAVEESARKAVDKMPAAKENAKKAISEAKSTASSVKRGRPAKVKKPDPVQETFFEFEGNQFLAESIVEKIKEAYKAEGHRVSSIKSLRTYINPYERKAYYVINDKAENKYIEF